MTDKNGHAEIKGGGEMACGKPKENENVVKIITIGQIWGKLRDHIPSTRVDILVLDVEGNEANVLACGELPDPKPSHILFEIAHLSIEVKDEIDEKLCFQGYSQSPDLIHRDALRSRIICLLKINFMNGMVKDFLVNGSFPFFYVNR